VEGFSRKLASPEKFIADASALAIVLVGWVSTFSEQFLLLSRVARWFPHGPPFALTLLHPSDPWPLPGHPEAIKMSCRRAYFHASAWKGNSPKFPSSIIQSAGLIQQIVLVGSF
jgi:hypothetical protein